MMIFTDDVIFPLGFLSFIVSLFTVSTISYDDFDNGNWFQWKSVCQLWTKKNFKKEQSYGLYNIGCCKEGYSYVGFIPTLIDAHGGFRRIDLIFEK